MFEETELLERYAFINRKVLLGSKLHKGDKI